MEGSQMLSCLVSRMWAGIQRNLLLRESEEVSLSDDKERSHWVDVRQSLQSGHWWGSRDDLGSLTAKPSWRRQNMYSIVLLTPSTSFVVVLVQAESLLTLYDQSAPYLRLFQLCKGQSRIEIAQCWGLSPNHLFFGSPKTNRPILNCCIMKMRICI